MMQLGVSGAITGQLAGRFYCILFAVQQVK